MSATMTTMAAPRDEHPIADPLLGEWACLGVLYARPAHGWAIAARLLPDSDIGRIWHVKRALAYRSLDQLARRGWVAPVGQEPGSAGPNRTILKTTRSGRAQFRSWVRTPVAHRRDLRSELLLKFVLADLNDIDITKMLDQQRDIIARHADVLLASGDATDVVDLWRIESTRAAHRFIEQIHPAL